MESLEDFGREWGGRHSLGTMKNLASGQDFLGIRRLEHGGTRGTGQENVTSPEEGIEATGERHSQRERMGKQQRDRRERLRR